jgi:acetyl esterase
MRERTPIDIALRRFLDEQAAAFGSPVEMTDQERTEMLRARMVRALENRGSIPGLPNKVESHDVEILPGLGARLYRPPGLTVPTPVLVYLHGGGWVIGSFRTHDPFCRLLCQAAGVTIVSVGYRLAPENPYPAALEDTRAAVAWVAAHAAEWGADTGRLILGGDSSGANLAAVVANRLTAEAWAPSLHALLLLYPVTDSPGPGHASYTENATGYGLETTTMRWFWKQYAPDVSLKNPQTSPLQLSDVPMLPPTLIATAEYDVLRDEGIAYAEKLREAGVSVTHLHAPDMHHNFPVHPATVARFPQSQAALTAIANWVRAMAD